MKITDTVAEVKTFLRATQAEIEALNAEGEFIVTFSLGLQNSQMPTAAVKNLIESINESVSALPDSLKVQVTLDVNHQTGFDGTLLRGVKQRYEASKKLQAAS